MRKMRKIEIIDDGRWVREESLDVGG